MTADDWRLVAATSPDLAQLLARAVDGRKFYAFTAVKTLDLARELRPRLVLLDATLGGAERRAVEMIPGLVSVSPHSRVVLVMVGGSDVARAEAVQFGAFGTVDLTVATWRDRLEQIVAAESRAHRRHLALPNTAIVRRVSLH